MSYAPTISRRYAGLHTTLIGSSRSQAPRSSGGTATKFRLLINQKDRRALDLFIPLALLAMPTR